MFECISLYLNKGGLPRGGKSSEYQRQQLLGMIGSVDLLDFFIEKLSEYSEHGEECLLMSSISKHVLNAPMLLKMLQGKLCGSG